MLINGGTRSGKEVLAYGFKKYRLGELVGTQTKGAVLAATAFVVGSGLLLLAVEDVRVDGERLEGVGVTPTIEVQPEAASAGSNDPQLSRAVAVLSGGVIWATRRFLLAQCQHQLAIAHRCLQA
jgi:carboxyl-terminal processing protease